MRLAMRSVSVKMAKQKRLEKELILKLLERCHGLCELCGKWPDWRGLSKHEKIFRSQGGDPLDPNNCLMICGICHDKEHGIIDKKEGE
jgi:hypothetical protein